MKMVKNKWFSLIELLVVIVLIAIISIVAFISFGNQSSKARNSIRLENSSKILKAFQLQQLNEKIPSTSCLSWSSEYSLTWTLSWTWCNVVLDGSQEAKSFLNNLKISGSFQDPANWKVINWDLFQYEFNYKLGDNQYEFAYLMEPKEEGSLININKSYALDYSSWSINLLNIIGTFPSIDKIITPVILKDNNWNQLHSDLYTFDNWKIKSFNKSSEFKNKLNAILAISFSWQNWESSNPPSNQEWLDPWIAWSNLLKENIVKMNLNLNSKSIEEIGNTWILTLWYHNEIGNTQYNFEGIDTAMKGRFWFDFNFKWNWMYILEPKFIQQANLWRIYKESNPRDFEEVFIWNPTSNIGDSNFYLGKQSGANLNTFYGVRDSEVSFNIPQEEGILASWISFQEFNDRKNISLNLNLQKSANRIYLWFSSNETQPRFQLAGSDTASYWTYWFSFSFKWNWIYNLDYINDEEGPPVKKYKIYKQSNPEDFEIVEVWDYSFNPLWETNFYFWRTTNAVWNLTYWLKDTEVSFNILTDTQAPIVLDTDAPKPSSCGSEPWIVVNGIPWWNLTPWINTIKICVLENKSVENISVSNISFSYYRPDNNDYSNIPWTSTVVSIEEYPNTIAKQIIFTFAVDESFDWWSENFYARKFIWLSDWTNYKLSEY